ncbi:MAG TPA: TIGR02117 family protein [Saprospiraceae bacterium]|nr:TIGR02117 family protein [Saprospiraceae bacterium]
MIDFSILKKSIKYFAFTMLSIIAFLLVYLFAAYTLSRISLAAENDKPKDIPIYIKTNGVHTDIVVPVHHQLFDWSKEIMVSHTQSSDTNFKYLALGWGDKGFYLETPTWADLKVSTAFKAATGLSTAAVHGTFLKQVKESESCVKIEISKEQYQQLIVYITNSFKKSSDGHFMHINTKANYGKTDAFYEATGSYHLFHTAIPELSTH